ncbi:protein cereblon-like [Aphis gossypii]|uniref:Protein cereblon n=1 Tax=Aphis gossypii TaxID=80765 RepID=A0A9P0J1S5_APHGO|nr:protein cereblon-like [Aphis gossypii]XP_027852058.2 protein cereblon-like [Aphis gossypii]CAH1725076.1 unnamed protein product [Aphis gossypii]
MSDSDREEISINTSNMSDSDDHEHEEISPNIIRYELETVLHRNTVIYTNPVVCVSKLRLTSYDQNLTTAHQYLGNRLREATGRTVYEEGVIHVLPILFLKLNLMPGQILPIIAHSPNIKLVLKYAINRNRSFGVCYQYNLKGPTFGTIAEVYEHTADIETSEPLQVKAMGHQRFEIVEARETLESQQSSDLILVKIRIIPDTTLFMNSFNKLCLHPNKRHLNHREMCRKRDMWQTQWPDWVYKQFDVYKLASQLSKKLKMMYKNVKISDDPFLLSFQVLRLGMFSQEDVSELLGIESTNTRLQHEITLWDKLQKMQKFLCNHCNTPICDMSNVFPMSPEGPQGTYCNSLGKIHDMITVTELEEDLHEITVGIPSNECSWFPGYVWTIILCPGCHNHLGWRYMVEKNPLLSPKEFYGLTLSSISSFENYFVPVRDRHVDLDDGEMLVTF